MISFRLEILLNANIIGSILTVGLTAHLEYIYLLKFIYEYICIFIVYLNKVLLGCIIFYFEIFC